MTTISLALDDDVNAALETLCANQGRDKMALVAQLVRQYVEMEQLKSTLQDPALAQLYQELSAEDRLLAEEGLAEYQNLLHEADRP